MWDACLSFLSIFMQVERHREITVRYQNLEGEMLQSQAGDDETTSPSCCSMRSIIWTGFSRLIA